MLPVVQARAWELQDDPAVIHLQDGQVLDMRSKVRALHR